VLEISARNARAWIVAAELLQQLHPAAPDEPVAAFDAGLGREAPAAFRAALERRADR
jgi:hypothetical protein